MSRLKEHAKAFEVLQKYALESLPVLPARFQMLEDHGYIVVPNVIDEKTCDELMQGLKTWLVTAAGAERDPRTWRSSVMPYSIHNIYQHFGAGHIDPVWRLRQDERVVDVFASLWGTRDLLTSFDGFCLQPPHELVGKKGHVPGAVDGSWYHYDQGSYPGRHTVQGFVTLEDQDEQDATLMVVDKSHLRHMEFFRRFPGAHAKDGDWIKFTDEELRWVLSQEGAKEVRVKAKKGSMVLWDSRTAHCSGRALEGRPEARWRGVIYTCYAPRRLASEKDLAKKRKALEERRTTNHHPAQRIHLFPKEPRWGKKSAEFKLPTGPVSLSELGRRLAGL